MFWLGLTVGTTATDLFHVRSSNATEASASSATEPCAAVSVPEPEELLHGRIGARSHRRVMKIKNRMGQIGD